MTMHVSLTPQLEEIVKRKVESGMYHSSSEVVREAIRLLDERDRIQEMKLEALRHEIQLGLESGEARPVDFEDIKKRGRERLKQAGEKK